MTTRADSRILPPSVADARGLAFAETMGRALDEPDFRALLFERIDAAPAALLPFLVREFSVEEFVEPGMSDAVVRRLLKGSFELHRLKSNIAGVREGLRMLGMRVRWKQWFQQSPRAAPGTHELTVYVGEYLFDGQQALLDERAQRAALRMILGMKRASQDEAFRIGVAARADAGLAMAGAALQISTVRGDAAPITRPAAELGAAMVGATLQIAPLRADAAPAMRPAALLGAAMVGRALTLCRFSAEAVQ